MYILAYKLVPPMIYTNLRLEISSFVWEKVFPLKYVIIDFAISDLMVI